MTTSEVIKCSFKNCSVLLCEPPGRTETSPTTSVLSSDNFWRFGSERIKDIIVAVVQPGVLRVRQVTCQPNSPCTELSGSSGSGSGMLAIFNDFSLLKHLSTRPKSMGFDQRILENSTP